MQAVALLAQHKRNRHERTEADMTINSDAYFDEKCGEGVLPLTEDEKAPDLHLP